MSFIFQKNKVANNPSLWFGSAIASSILISSVAHAEIPSQPQEQVTPAKSAESALVHRLNQDLKETLSSNKNAQNNVTSVSQLGDVRPNDWAFTALQSLVERYGCIAGYRDRTYRGNQATSRDEFAAGLNACLDKINEIISAGLADKVSKEDLATLRKLQEEFAAELATLRGRVDALDVKTAKLESQQFSTTTKLFGQAIFGLQTRLNNTADINVRNGVRETADPATNLTYGASVQLSLLTQFPDRSILLTGLQAGNISTVAGLVNPPYFLNDTYTRLGYESNTGNTVQLSDLSYQFLPVKNLAVIVGPQGVNPVTVFRGPNRYESAALGPVSAFAQRNPIIGLGSTQAGIGLDWQINDRFSLQAVYSAGNGFGAASNATGSGGLFSGPYTAGLQLGVIPADNVAATFYYLRGYTNNGTLLTGVGDQLIGALGTTFLTDAYGASASWRINPKITLGGWLGFTSSAVQATGVSGTVETFNWMTYLNFPDLFLRGDLAGIYLGMPPKITSSNLTAPFNIPSLISGTGGVAGSQPSSTTHLELFYRFRLNSNISITPAIIFLFNSVQTAGSDTITIGSLRTTFTF